MTKKITPEINAKVIELRNQGLKYKELISIFGFCRDTLRLVVNPPPPKPRKILKKDNPNYKKEYSSKYQIEHRKEITERKRLYRQKNKEKINENLKKYFKNNLSAKIKNILRSRIRHALLGLNKSKSTMELLGCNIEFFKNYIAEKFKNGMKWENYGKYGWHIDHIKPCATFDLSNSEEQNKCFHYSNLQPLWAFDNLSKHHKYEN